MTPLIDVSTGRVILEVKKRPVLWSSCHNEYKNKYARQRAWNEVICALIPEFPNLLGVQQYDADRAIQQRWKTARDAYMRCKSVQKTGKLKKKYFYYDYLSFLDKNDVDHTKEPVESVAPQSPPAQATIDADDPLASSSSEISQIQSIVKEEAEFFQYNDDFEEPTLDSDPENSSIRSEVEDDQIEIEIPEKTRKTFVNKGVKRKLGTGFNKQIFKMLKQNSQLLKDDNLSFFMSLVPIVSKFSDQQKLMFRAEVINVAMEISKSEA